MRYRSTFTAILAAAYFVGGSTHGSFAQEQPASANAMPSNALDMGTTAPSEPYTALRPGLWEIRTATRMQGMPYELPPVPYNTKQCLTQELLNNQENLAQVTATRGKCQIHDATVTNERTDWTMTCYQNGMEIDAKGRITPITRETYTGNVHFMMHKQQVQALSGVVNVQGIWQGECNTYAPQEEARPTYHRPVYTPQ